MMPVFLPPLRERRGDVPLLASYFIDRYSREFRKRVRTLARTVSATAIKLPPESLKLDEVER